MEKKNRYVIDKNVYEKHIDDEVHLYSMLHQLAFQAGRVKDAEDLAALREKELEPLSSLLAEHDVEKMSKALEQASWNLPYIIHGSSFRLLVGSIFELLARYCSMTRRIMEAKTRRISSACRSRCPKTAAWSAACAGAGACLRNRVSPAGRFWSGPLRRSI